MIKGKIFEKCRKYFEDYLFGFDQDHMQMSLLTGHIDLNNVNIKPDKVNEIFAQANMPIALKAGLISKLSIDLNIWRPFSDALKVTVEDMLFIIGPNISHISKDEDFDHDLSGYDENNPLNNLFKMHQRFKKDQEVRKEAEREKRREEKAKKNEELKEKIEESKEKKEKKASGELKEPPMMDTIMNFLGGFKLELKRIHIRYEDDYFQHNRPFSFGFMIDSISLDNSDTDWIFQAPLSILINKNRPENTVIKEL
jgi:hypothetical protein